MLKAIIGSLAPLNNGNFFYLKSTIGTPIAAIEANNDKHVSKNE